MNEGQTNTHTGLEVFQPLRKAQTGNFIEITDSDKNSITSVLTQDIRTKIPKSLMFRRDYIESRIQFILSQIQGNVGRNYEKVSYFSSEDGMYRFFDSEKKEIYRANLLDLWNQSDISPEELLRIQQEAHDQESKLKEVMNRESVMGGSMILEFTTTAVIGSAVAHSALSGTQEILNLKAIWIKNSNGRMERVSLGDKVVQGTRDWMKNNALKVSEQLLIKFDPSTKTSINIGARAVQDTLKIIEKITLAELRQKYGISISEAQFYKLKKEFPELAALMKNSGNNVVEMSRWAIGKGLHVLMFPIFYLSFQQQPNSATLASGVAEMLLFNQGAKVGGAIGKFGGPIGKFFGPIVGGVGAIVGGHELYQKLDGDIEKWKIFNGKDIFSYKSSAILHLATGWGVSEYFDWFNDGGFFHNEEEARELLGGGFDIGLPSIDWGKYLPENWAKKGPIGLVSGGTGVTPEIALYKRKVNFSMNPWEWFNASLKGRTVEKWNTMVDVYKDSLLDDIAKLLGAFHGNQYPFDGGKGFDEKKNILESRLAMLLASLGTSTFQPQANSVILLILSEISHWNKDTSIGFIRQGVSNYVSYMKIDETFIRLNQMKIDSSKNELNLEIEKFASQIHDTKQKEYIMSLMGRVISDKPLFAPDSIIISNNPFSDRVDVKQSAEHILFNTILDNKDRVNRDTLDKDGNPSVESLEIRKLFAIILDKLAIYSRLVGFQKRITKAESNKNGGEFVELEKLSSIFQ